MKPAAAPARARRAARRRAAQPRAAPRRPLKHFWPRRETPEEVKSLPTYVWPYLYAKLPQYTGSLSQAVPHDLVDDVIKVVGTEGPVHVDLVYARIGAAWKVSRLTAKVKQLINTAIGMAVHDQRIEQRGDVSVADRVGDTHRARAEGRR